ncbi:MAG: response regulator [Spirochaetales bacterium]|nr:response regulator [Spirochaetales bacterium]
MGKKILIIDDDPDYIEAIESLLEAKGYSVESADNGRDGMQKAISEKPDLILLDVMMTEITEGFDLARKLKADSATGRIPVILITGIRREMHLPFGIEPDDQWLPVKAVLEKPIHPDTLLKKISEILVD